MDGWPLIDPVRMAEQLHRSTYDHPAAEFRWTVLIQKGFTDLEYQSSERVASRDDSLFGVFFFHPVIQELDTLQVSFCAVSHTIL